VTTACPRRDTDGTSDLELMLDNMKWGPGTRTPNLRIKSLIEECRSERSREELDAHEKAE